MWYRHIVSVEVFKSKREEKWRLESNRIESVLVQEILSVYWSLGLTSTRFLKSRAVTVYLLQERSTNTKNPVDTRTVQAGLGPSYPVHCVYIMGVVKLPKSKSEEDKICTRDRKNNQ